MKNIPPELKYAKLSVRTELSGIGYDSSCRQAGSKQCDTGWVETFYVWYTQRACRCGIHTRRRYIMRLRRTATPGWIAARRSRSGDWGASGTAFGVITPVCGCWWTGGITCTIRPRPTSNLLGTTRHAAAYWGRHSGESGRPVDEKLEQEPNSQPQYRPFGTL